MNSLSLKRIAWTLSLKRIAWTFIGALLVLSGLPPEPVLAQGQGQSASLLSAQVEIDRIGPDKPSGQADFLIDDASDINVLLVTGATNVVTRITAPPQEAESIEIRFARSDELATTARP